MIAPRRLASTNPPNRPLRPAPTPIRRHRLRHRIPQRGGITPERAPGPISLWRDDRRGLPLKWTLLALLLLGLALLEGPL